MNNLKANPWEIWIGDHRFLTYIFKWEQLNVVDRPILARATNDWPRYITTNWPRVVPQKVHRCQESKIFWPTNPPWEIISVKPRFLGSISHVVYTCQLWVSDEMRYCIVFLTVFDALRIVEPSPEKAEPSLDEAESHHWSKMVRPLLICNQ